ncbi:thaumatin-like protein [Phtheirospermum japonicum]|uniref:Thaumatin-like protein n=1 Tax=Phtheirospermum japonicum TaxID=374723 RepID=A0A830CLL3_9LAMI|nr:thaumatin-like protein [Phtheirospermum japonicum]
MAWNPARRRKTPAGERRPGAQAGPNSHRRRANRVVGPLLGQNGLRLRPIGPERELHHRRLRRPPGMRRQRWLAAGVPAGVHPGQPGGLLRRQPRRRVQPARFYRPLRRVG